MKKLIKNKKPITALTVFVTVLLGFGALHISKVIANEEETERDIIESKKIMALANMWSDKLAEGDVDWIMNIHATGSIQFPAGAKMIQGEEAMRAAWTGMINTEGLDVSWKSTAAFVSASNDMAYDYGIVKVKSPDGSTEDGKYLVVWTREDGEWKIALNMYNSDGAPTK